MTDAEGQSAPTSETNASLPLPDPYPEYLPCPHCGEPDVEVWCYQTKVRCHHCGQWFAHTPPPCRGTTAICRVAIEMEQRQLRDKPDI